MVKNRHTRIESCLTYGNSIQYLLIIRLLIIVLPVKTIGQMINTGLNGHEFYS